MITVTELNEIHAQWMALDSNGPKSEIDRVCKLMEKCPKVYVSGHDGKGVCIHSGAPLSMTVDFDQAMDQCKANGGRTDIAWNGKLGIWYKPCPICFGTHPVGCCAQDGRD